MMIDPRVDDERHPITPRQLRQFAVIWLIVFGGIACRDFLRHRPILAGIWLFLAVLVAAPGIVSPQGIRWLFVALLAVTWPIGWVMSKFLLAVLYCGIIIPIGLLHRLLRRDALALQPRRNRQTYWLQKSAPADIRSYLRQS